MKEEQMNQMFVRLCKDHNLNPAFLRQILPLRSQGYNNTQIAEITGISRVTVNNYIDKISQLQGQEDLKKLLLLGLGLFAGYHILKEIFGD